MLRVASTARLLIISQAPGRKVHESGVPWDDASGARLREWLMLEAAAEGLGIALLDAIDSDDPTALVGLPLIRTCRMLRAAGVKVL